MIPYQRHDDLVGYTYKADQFCVACILSQIAPPNYPNPQPVTYVELALDYFAALAGVDRTNESSFDTDDFPKLLIRGWVRVGEDPLDDKEGYDPTDRCGSCHTVLKDVEA